MKSLYEQHSWFELRKAIDGHDVPPLYKGAVAAAFNESRTAEKNLDQAIKLEHRSHDAADAHEMLADLYIRCGRCHEAAQQLDALLRIKPDDRDAQNARALGSGMGQTSESDRQRRNLTMQAT
jgi:predicted Zn-dependent protease